MQALSFSHPYMLCCQSATGPVRWLGPGAAAVLRQLGKQQQRSVLFVPVAFVSDHIETLYEIDIEFMELAAQSGIQHFERTPALNASPGFLDGLADIAAEHLKSGETCSRQYLLRCSGCANSQCRAIANPARGSDPI